MTSFRTKILISSGTKFGRLTVVGPAEKDEWGAVRWTCRCECGTPVVVKGTGLRRGNPKSCGCLNQDVTMGRSIRHGETRRGARSPEWSAWSSMIYRCHYPLNRSYPNYGGRGIVVCDRWRELFENFLEDMGRRPSPHHSLDRIDNDGPYSPENCRWSDNKAQHRNKRINTILEYAGKRMTLAAWAECTGIPSSVISHRILGSWTVERALTTPVHRKARLKAFMGLQESDLAFRFEMAVCPCFIHA